MFGRWGTACGRAVGRSVWNPVGRAGPEHKAVERSIRQSAMSVGQN